MSRSRRAPRKGAAAGSAPGAPAGEPPPARSWRARIGALAVNLALSLAAVCAVAAGAEAWLRLSGAGGPRHLLVVSGSGPNAVVESARYETGPRLPIRINPLSFPVAKPAGGVRVFCFGGSTVYGYPYAPKGTFPNILQALLREANPGRSVEVINAGLSGGDSARALELMRDAAAFSPDAFIVYSGQNEFLKYDYPLDFDQSFDFNPRSGAPLGRRLQAALLDSLLLRRVRGLPFVVSWCDAREERLYGYVGAHSGRLSPEELELVYRSYGANLEDMAAVATGARARIVYCTVVSNLRSSRPLSLLKPGTSTRMKLLLRDLDARVEEEARTDPERALATLRAARATLPPEPFIPWREGTILLRMNRIAAADAAFREAIENDGLRHRAPARINETIRSVAKASGAPLCDLEGAFRRASPYGIVGSELILDHVHPTLEGLTLMAREIAATLEDAGLVSQGASGRVSDATLRAAIGMTTAEWRLGLTRLGLSAAGRGDAEQAAGLFRQASQRFDPDEPHRSAEARYLEGVAAYLSDDRDAARQALEDVRRNDPAFFAELNERYAQLGIATSLEGR